MLPLPRQGSGIEAPHLPPASSQPPLNLLPYTAWIFLPYVPRDSSPLLLSQAEQPAKAGVKKVSRCHITPSAAILPQSHGRAGSQYEAETDIIPFLLRSTHSSVEPERLSTQFPTDPPVNSGPFLHPKLRKGGEELCIQAPRLTQTGPETVAGQD